jgi:hypothetical protein
MSPKAIISVVIFLCLCGWAGWSGGRVMQRFDLERDARTDAKTRLDVARMAFAETGGRSVLEQAEQLAGALALPRAPLGALAVGVSPVYESARQASLAPALAAFDTEPLESGHFLRDWHLDLLTVILVALPVLILFGPGLDAALAVAAGLIGSLVGFLASGPEFGSADVWLRLALWLLVTAVYGWFWTLTRAWLDQARGGEAFAIAIYALVVFLIPGLGALVARTITPPPSGAATLAEIRRAGKGQELRDAAALAKFHMGHPGAVDGEDPSDYDRLKLASLREWEKIAAGPVDGYESALGRHRFVGNVLRVLSPAAAAQGALLEIAGTSAARHLDFAEQVKAFSRNQWAPFFAKRAGQGQALTAGDLGKVPQFVYQSPSVLLSLLTILLFTLPVAGAALYVGRLR